MSCRSRSKVILLSGYICRVVDRHEKQETSLWNLRAGGVPRWEYLGWGRMCSYICQQLDYSSRVRQSSWWVRSDNLRYRFCFGSTFYFSVSD
jgi:hypothetical protein